MRSNNLVLTNQKSPCLMCKDRYVGCHSKCEKYLDYQAKGKEERKAKRERYSKARDYADFKKTVVEKARRAKGKKNYGHSRI